MAELILSSSGPHRGPGAESYFDFEPGNTAMLEAIETLLARRSGTTGHEEHLAELCAKSVEDGATVLYRATLVGWIDILRNLTRRVRSGNSRTRRRQLNGKSGNRGSLPGPRRRFSFA